MKDYNAIKWNDFVYYDETSPTFLRWKIERRSGKGGIRLMKAVGEVAGYMNGDGYLSTKLFGSLYKNHRIVWCLFHNHIDHKLQIDHIDGDRGNNKIENLRLVTRTVNNRNSTVSRNNTTGVTGVSLMSNNDGNFYYTAHWQNLDGGFKQKYFSIDKLGETEAFRLACEYRTRMIKELNEQGAGYTERHGT